MLDDQSHYIGGELQTFLHATNWKAYWSRHVRPSVKGDVLEVGAGIGANTATLQTSEVRSWHCVEPDHELARQAREATAAITGCHVTEQTTAELIGRSYDTVLYIDVLEHIEKDREELARAESLLRPGGRLIVLSPAHQWLFSPFDAAIGHYRRYNKASLRSCGPSGSRLVAMIYLDSLGGMLSLANRALLRKALPSLPQVLLWDRRVVPLSRLVDPLLGYRLGKSILGIWQKS